MRCDNYSVETTRLQIIEYFVAWWFEFSKRKSFMKNDNVLEETNTEMLNTKNIINVFRLSEQNGKNVIPIYYMIQNFTVIKQA